MPSTIVLVDGIVRFDGVDDRYDAAVTGPKPPLGIRPRRLVAPIYDCRRSCFRRDEAGEEILRVTNPGSFIFRHNTPAQQITFFIHSPLIAPRSDMTRSYLQRVHIVDSDLSMSRSTQSTGLGTWPHSPAPNRGNDLSEYLGKRRA